MSDRPIIDYTGGTDEDGTNIHDGDDLNGDESEEEEQGKRDVEVGDPYRPDTPIGGDDDDF